MRFDIGIRRSFYYCCCYWQVRECCCCYYCCWYEEIAVVTGDVNFVEDWMITTWCRQITIARISYCLIESAHYWTLVMPHLWQMMRIPSSAFLQATASMNLPDYYWYLIAQTSKAIQDTVDSHYPFKSVPQSAETYYHYNTASFVKMWLI